MPSEKRARKRAARDAKMEALARQQKRRAALRRTITVVVVAAVAVGIYFLVSSPSKKAASSTTTTTTAPTTTTTISTAQAAANTVAVTAGCPQDPTSPLKKPSWSSPPAMTIDTSKTYTATVKTDVGTFTIALDAKAAPHTVNNFVFLADQHFFDCMAFMRVIPGFMNQTGSPSQSNGAPPSGPGYQFDNENASPAGGYTSGEVAMANSGPNTNGSQFFVLVGPYDNPGYSLFGTVSSGMSVVQKINGDGSASGTPVVTHRMLSVTITES